jgi:DNA-binding HxlR family transcriptional regulator
MKFDEQLNESIVKVLSQNSNHYMGLFHEIQSYRHVSLDTFNSHIKTMLSEGYIDKNDTGKRGKKVYYFLTEKTKQLQRLKILEFKSKRKRAEYILYLKSKNEIAESNSQSEEERRVNMYLLIFFLTNTLGYTFKTEEQLNDFLSEAGVSRNDLVLRCKPHEDQFDGKPCITTVWTIGSRIYVNKWEMAADKNIVYGCMLPGQSPSEVLLQSKWGRVFAHANITQTEMADAFNMAEKEGMLKIVMKFRNQIRYDIVDQSLVNFIGDCWELFELLLEKLQIVWRTIRGPNNQEIRWLELIKDRWQADTIRMQAYHKRHSLKESKRKRKKTVRKEIENREIAIEEFLTELKKRHAYTIDKYRFPAERILEIIAPRYLQKTNL